MGEVYVISGVRCRCGEDGPESAQLLMPSRRNPNAMRWQNMPVVITPAIANYEDACPRCLECGELCELIIEAQV